MIAHWIKAQDGKTYPVRFSNSVYMQLAIMEDVPVNKATQFFKGFSEWTFGRMYRFYWLAFKSGAKAENIDFTLGEEDFIEFITNDETLIPQVVKIMLASQPDQKKTVTKARR